MNPRQSLRIALCAAFVGVSQTTAQTLEVTSAGVGIGTSTPDLPLTVFGWNTLSRFKSSGASALLYLTPTYGDEWRIGAGDLNVSDFGIRNMTDEESRLTITGEGHVGIGTPGPGGLLHIKGEFVPGYTQLAVTSTAADDRSGMTFWSSGGQRMMIFYANSDGNSYLAGTEHTSGVFHIYSAGAERMTFLPSGNIGIGTPSPGYKLEVAGSVKASSFISNSTTYADFVFKPDYKLRSLREVEAAIEIHGHLPEIPSEAEAKANGIDLAKMQVKLLQKVEELTLYLLAHDKELQQLREKNEKLERQLSKRPSDENPPTHSYVH